MARIDHGREQRIYDQPRRQMQTAVLEVL